MLNFCSKLPLTPIVFAAHAKKSMNSIPLFGTPFVLEYFLQFRNFLVVGASHNEIINFTTDENPTISVVLLVYASLMFAALEPTTGQQLI